MVSICGTDKFIIRSIHQIPDTLDLACSLIYKLLWSDACSLCLLLDLLSVLIGTGLEEHIVSLSSLISCNTVCQHDLIGVADMRLTGSICDGSCNIIRFFLTILTHILNPSFQPPFGAF